MEVFGQRFRPTWTRLATSATAGESTLELMDQAKFGKKTKTGGVCNLLFFFHIELLQYFLQFLSILSFGFGLLFLFLRTFASFLFSGYVFNEARVSKKLLVARIVDQRAQKSKLQRCESNSFCETVTQRDTLHTSFSLIHHHFRVCFQSSQTPPNPRQYIVHTYVNCKLIHTSYIII